MVTERTFFLLFLGLLHLNTNGDSQLIGEEKKYVFLEQIVLERIRSAALATKKGLETRVGRLEEENKRILSELKSIKDAKFPPEKPNKCPTPSNCVVSEFMCPRFYMDPTTLHSANLSRDNLTLSNRPLNGPTGSDRKYQGVQGSRLITSMQKTYFETEVFYRIEDKLTDTNLVFEVAFATENAISESHYVGRQMEAWSINAHFDSTQGGVILFCKSNGGSATHSEKISEATSGTKKNLTLGFLLNSIDRSIAAFDIKKNEMICTFTEVDRFGELWPVFGVYQSIKTYVRLRLNTQMEITRMPCGLI